jgi:hypothetical protein
MKIFLCFAMILSSSLAFADKPAEIRTGQLDINLECKFETIDTIFHDAWIEYVDGYDCTEAYQSTEQTLKAKYDILKIEPANAATTELFEEEFRFRSENRGAFLELPVSLKYYYFAPLP